MDNTVILVLEFKLIVEKSSTLSNGQLLLKVSHSLIDMDADIFSFRGTRPYFENSDSEETVCFSDTDIEEAGIRIELLSPITQHEEN